jgi:hypothetical protein
MSGIIGVSPDMRSGIVGKYPGKIASDTYSVGGHILQSWYRKHTSASCNGTGNPNTNSGGAILSCTCTGGNFLDCSAIGGYVGTASTRDTQYIGIRFTENSVNEDIYSQRFEILSAYVSGSANALYTIPGSGTKTVTIDIVNKADPASGDTRYWTFGSDYPLIMICHEIQG